MLPPSAAHALRLAFGVLFLWLGLLKIVPGMSPAEDLMRAALPAFLPIDAFIRFASFWEILVGIGFLTGRFRRPVVLMTFATMFVTLSILWMAPQMIWASFPFGLTFEGVYVVKDLIIATSAIVLAVATVQERPNLDGRFAAFARRRWPGVVDRYLTFEGRSIAAVAPYSIPLLRAALGVVFIWFGALNLVDPTASPTWPMVEAAIPGEQGAIAFQIWGAVGIIAGVGVLTGLYKRVAVVLLVAMMVTSTLWFVLAPEIMFQQPPFVLSLEGQHVVKNLVIAAAAIVVLRARPASAPVRAPAEASQPEASTSGAS